MDKWFGWIKAHLALVVAILFLLIVGVPFAIHICFKINTPYEFLTADWDSGSVLSYYGSILGFLGTVILSMLALYQNQEIKIESDKRTEMLQSQIHSPELKLDFIPYLFNFNNIQFELRNISNNLADNINVSDFELYDGIGNRIEKSNHAKLPRSSLSGGETFTFEFTHSKIEGTNLKLVFRVSCQDKFNKEHKYEAIISIVNAEHPSAKALNFIKL